MKWLVIFMALLALAFVEANWGRSLWFNPTPTLIFLLFCLFVFDFSRVVQLAVIAGLIMEQFSSFPFGVYTGALFLSLLTCFFILSSFLSKHHKSSLFILVGFATLLLFISEFMLSWILQGVFSDFWVRLRWVALTSVLPNLAMAAVVLLFDKNIFRKQII